MTISYHRNDILFPPNIKNQYSTKYSQYHPRPCELFPFKPAITSKSTQHTIKTPLVFKIQHNPRITPEQIKNILAYKNSDNKYFNIYDDPSHSIITQSRTHPLICYTNFANIGQHLISAKYTHHITLDSQTQL
jgi:hypothetical protein